jgi:yeast amino acid transporter
MSINHDVGAEKHANAVPDYETATLEEHTRDGQFSSDPENMENKLHKDLKGRHMQMIAMQVQHTESSAVY